ncbi:unnamed protein product [Mycetohabitans rhizoxinica HKI 454]|uniref:Uncharacterized protein n=1 Tax=Mycetohabitans rhizoxinica (strain DSM 19002 / CIP 109453 / HKI 454) TaxID=882378 RepID=E5ASR3_MYCRK|nr:unnamed protein product [Mycetohabitans rhizoxinica HKI 454]
MSRVALRRRAPARGETSACHHRGAHGQAIDVVVWHSWVAGHTRLAVTFG